MNSTEGEIIESEPEINLSHVLTEILRHQFFRKKDIPKDKKDCLLNVCDKLIYESRAKQERMFQKTPDVNANNLEEKVNFAV